MEAGMACGLSLVTPEHTGHCTASDQLILLIGDDPRLLLCSTLSTPCEIFKVSKGFQKLKFTNVKRH